MLGKTVTVTVDRALGTYHPEHPDMYYPNNYGYIKGIIAPDGEEQDDKKTSSFSRAILCFRDNHVDVNCKDMK